MKCRFLRRLLLGAAFALPGVALVSQPAPVVAQSPSGLDQMLVEFANRGGEIRKARDAGQITRAIALAEQQARLNRQIIAEMVRVRESAELLNTARLQLAQNADFMGQHYLDADNFTAALPLLKESAQLMEQIHNRNHDQAIDARLAVSYAEQLQKSSPIDRQQLRGADAKSRQVQKVVAAGDYRQASKLTEELLVTRITLLGQKHPRVAEGLINYGAIQKKLGNPIVAQRAYKTAIEILKESVGTRHPAYADVLNNAGTLAMDLGDFKQAIAYYQESREIRRTVFGEASLLYAASLNNLATIYQAVPDYDQAAELLQASLKIYAKLVGEQDRNFILTLSNLVDVSAEQGQTDKAEALGRESVRLARANFGADNPDTALVEWKLAKAYLAAGKPAEAEPLLKKSLESRLKRFGATNPLINYSLNQLVRAQAAAGRWRDAAATQDRARRLAQAYVSRVLPALDEHTQLNFLTSGDQGPFQRALGLGLAQKSDAQIVELSAGWLLNGKALVHQSLAEQTLLNRDSGNSALRQTIEALKNVRAQLAAFALADKPNQSALEQLTRQETELAKAINYSRGLNNQARAWVELAELRAKVPADAVLIDIAKVFTQNFSRPQDAWGQQANYVAWIIPPAGRGAVKIVDLGPVEAINREIDAVRKTLADSPRQVRAVGEDEAEQALRTSMTTLTKQLIEPLAREIGGTTNWIISPDANLWLVPWSMLPHGKGYLVERHELSYVISGRDLVTQGASSSKPAQPIVMADPDYALTRPSPFATASNTTTAGDDGAAPISRSFKLGEAQRLPGTADEAVAIKSSLAKFAGQEPTVLTGGQALESVFKKVQHPHTVVLSTHGFFLDNEANNSAELRAADSDQPKSAALENPLVRCGLLLAGANRRAEGVPGKSDDGILTGLEIVGVDLRGTQMVVLSACETGVGTVRDGEGVAGLRQAFQLAGAQAVVASAWPVPDAATAVLMSDFFQNLAAGQSKASALRQAQLTAIKQRRERHGGAHPLFWAAFTVTGR